MIPKRQHSDEQRLELAKQCLGTPVGHFYIAAVSTPTGDGVWIKPGRTSKGPVDLRSWGYTHEDGTNLKFRALVTVESVIAPYTRTHGVPYMEQVLNLETLVFRLMPSRLVDAIRDGRAVVKEIFRESCDTALLCFCDAVRMSRVVEHQGHAVYLYIDPRPKPERRAQTSISALPVAPEEEAFLRADDDVAHELAALRHREVALTDRIRCLEKELSAEVERRTGLELSLTIKELVLSELQARCEELVRATDAWLTHEEKLVSMGRDARQLEADEASVCSSRSARSSNASSKKASKRDPVLHKRARQAIAIKKCLLSEGYEEGPSLTRALKKHMQQLDSGERQRGGPRPATGRLEPVVEERAESSNTVNTKVPSSVPSPPPVPEDTRQTCVDAVSPCLVCGHGPCQCQASCADGDEIPVACRVRGDHRCLFRACLRQLHHETFGLESTEEWEPVDPAEALREQQGADDLRGAVCDVILSRVSILRELLGVVSLSFDECNAYVNGMRAVDEWCDNAVVNFMPYVFHRPVTVWALHPDSGRVFVDTHCPQDVWEYMLQPALAVQYNGADHYDIVDPTWRPRDVASAGVYYEAGALLSALENAFLSAVGTGCVLLLAVLANSARAGSSYL